MSKSVGHGALLAFEDMALSVRGRGVGGLAVVETYQATTPHARVLHHW